jgi:hypothetical protein
VHEDPKDKGLLYAGTEQGIYVSFDDGADWQSLQLNLPMSPVYDMAIHGDDLVVATHGRAFWVLDNITPLRQANRSIASEPAHLYTPAVAYRVHGGGRGGGGGGRRNSAQNPPVGAVIDYYLGAAASGPVTIDILDSQGQVVHHGSSDTQAPAAAVGRGGRGGGAAGGPPTARRGLNRFVWNFRLDGPKQVPGMVISETSGAGPAVPPGTYQVKLNAGGKEYTTELVVKADPRVKVSQADFDKQYEFAVKLRDRVSDVNSTVNEIRAARAALKPRKADSSEAQAIDALEQKMGEIEGQLIQVASVTRWADLVYPIELDAQYADLMNVVESADSAPTAQTYEVFETYEHKQDDLMSRWKAVKAEIAQLRGE